MEQKKHYEQLSFYFTAFGATDIVCASPTGETIDGTIEDSIWQQG